MLTKPVGCERVWEGKQRIADYPAAGFKPEHSKSFKEVLFFSPVVFMPFPSAFMPLHEREGEAGPHGYNYWPTAEI